MNRIVRFFRDTIGYRALGVWCIVFIFSFFHSAWISVWLAFLIGSLTIVSMTTVYYLNADILIPRLMIKGRKLWYVASVLAMLVLAINISAKLEIYFFEQLSEIPMPFQDHEGIFSASKYISLLTVTYAVSCLVAFGRKAKETVRQKEVLLAERKTLEARVLKSQINSHFVFNALNNIYSMVYFKDEYTSRYILKLAQMMRYVMEDCETELTPLVKDIEYIENFIHFQKLRFESDKDIDFRYVIGEEAPLSVPPMIFQPLVENCFKHTPLEVDKNSYIHIFLEADHRHIYFVAENSQPIIKHRPAPKEPGIGIENVRRRLDLYYEGRYKFEISDLPESFKIELTITLHKPNDHEPTAKRTCC